MLSQYLFAIFHATSAHKICSFYFDYLEANNHIVKIVIIFFKHFMRFFFCSVLNQSWYFLTPFGKKKYYALLRFPFLSLPLPILLKYNQAVSMMVIYCCVTNCPKM